MRILILCHEFPPIGGGAGNALKYLLNEFKHFDITFDVITASERNFRISTFSSNITVYYLDIGRKSTNKNPTNFHSFIFAFRSFFFVKKLMTLKSYDLCHAFFGIPSGFTAYLLDIPYFISLMGSDVPFHRKELYWMDKLFLKRISGIVWKKAKVVVANSNGLKLKALSNYPHSKMDVITTGVDLNEFSRSNRNIIGTNTLKVISTGRLEAIKGYNYLIDAISDMKNIELILIGEGNEKTNLRNIAKTSKAKIKLMGYIPHDQIAMEYGKADVFVLPSLNEGMSNSMLEAMACGLPIISTNTGGTKELINGNGFIVKMRDAVAIKNAILNYIENPDLIRDHGIKSRKIAERFDWKHIAEAYLKIYNEFS